MVTWRSINPGIASISPQGLATAVAAGVTDIEVRYLGLSLRAPITVLAPPPPPPPPVVLQSIAIPGSVSLQVNETVQLTATGTFSDGHQENLTALAGWGSSNPLVATVAGGAVSGLAAGNAVIVASSQGINSNNCAVTVMPLPPPPESHEFINVAYLIRINGHEEPWGSSNLPANIDGNAQWRVTGQYRGTGMNVVVNGEIPVLARTTRGDPVSLPASANFTPFQALTPFVGLFWSANTFQPGQQAFIGGQLLRYLPGGAVEGIDGVGTVSHLLTFTGVQLTKSQILTEAQARAGGAANPDTRWFVGRTLADFNNDESASDSVIDPAAPGVNGNPIGYVDNLPGEAGRSWNDEFNPGAQSAWEYWVGSGKLKYIPV